MSTADRMKAEFEAKKKKEQAIETVAACGIVSFIGILLVCPFVSCVIVVYIVAEAAVKMAGQ